MSHGAFRRRDWDVVTETIDSGFHSAQLIDRPRAASSATHASRANKTTAQQRDVIHEPVDLAVRPGHAGILVGGARLTLGVPHATVESCGLAGSS